MVSIRIQFQDLFRLRRDRGLHELIYMRILFQYQWVHWSFHKQIHLVHQLAWQVPCSIWYRTHNIMDFMCICFPYSVVYWIVRMRVNIGILMVIYFFPLLSSNVWLGRLHGARFDPIDRRHVGDLGNIWWVDFLIQ